MLKILSAFVLSAIMALAHAGACEETPLLYMINVGKGDAILVFNGDDIYLVDAAKSGAYDRVQAALESFGVSTLKGVFLTHTDKDHAGGLKKLSKSSIEIEAWYASAYYAREPGEHQMAQAAARRGQTVTWLYPGDTVDGIFTVLAPGRVYGDEDNNSLVMMLEINSVRVLLTGDMEYKEERDLLSQNYDLSCDIFKVPNHADNDVCSLLELETLGAKYALITTDPAEKPGTPDEALMRRLENAGMQIFRTDLSEHGILVTLADEGINIKVD